MVRGTEKVILIQEQLMRNRILIDSDSDGDVFAQVTSSDTERKTMTKIKHKKGRFLLQHNCFQDRDGINLVAVLKAMGVESDQVQTSASFLEVSILSPGRLFILLSNNMFTG